MRMGQFPEEVTETEGGDRNACSLEGGGIIDCTCVVPGRRPLEEAVMVTVPARALVVSSARVDIVPAGIVTRLLIEMMPDCEENSWTTVSDGEGVGFPEVSIRPTSSTEYELPSAGSMLPWSSGLIDRPLGAQALEHELVATVTTASPDTKPVEDAVMTAVPRLVLVRSTPVPRRLP